MNESQKIAEKNISDTELITTNKKCGAIKTSGKKISTCKGKSKTPHKFDKGIKEGKQNKPINPKIKYSPDDTFVL